METLLVLLGLIIFGVVLFNLVALITVVVAAWSSERKFVRFCGVWLTVIYVIQFIFFILAAAGGAS